MTKPTDDDLDTYPHVVLTSDEDWDPTILENEIDLMNSSIEPIKSFVLPGGSIVSSQLHLCRTTCRRAERYVVELMEKEDINPEVLKYLNRLSDWFFVSARKYNENGKNDILWVPSKNKKE